MKIAHLVTLTTSPRRDPSSILPKENDSQMKLNQVL